MSCQTSSGGGQAGCNDNADDNDHLVGIGVGTGIAIFLALVLLILLIVYKTKRASRRYNIDGIEEDEDDVERQRGALDVLDDTIVSAAVWEHNLAMQKIKDQQAQQQQQQQQHQQQQQQQETNVKIPKAAALTPLDEHNASHAVMPEKSSNPTGKTGDDSHGDGDDVSIKEAPPSFQDALAASHNEQSDHQRSDTPQSDEVMHVPTLLSNDESSNALQKAHLDNNSSRTVDSSIDGDAVVRHAT